MTDTMFDTLLVANRGEIACRIMRTARQMGLRTVAVYSDADANALHVQQADQAIRLGPAPVADSYLRGDLIIEAALAAGAQAIHPGYGFLSENPDFVDAVTAAGLVFVGPSAAAIRAMGLKDAAKDLMEQAGVPVVPGYRGANQDPDHLAAMAQDIGFPVLIKAVAGGGGKGMRRVDTAKDFAENLASAKAEAQTAFGNAHVLIEKYILSPRHIEIQVFGDGTDAVHLFERDCSLQRRHQKVIEEAPAPGMTADMRRAMGQAAVKAARAIGYKGAGTVEFIVDGAQGLRPDGFWFMEMNTRLQVEHPVTEAVTGVDLVAWQLHVAAGQGLPCTQDDLSLNGHAFEARIYAEDVPAGFLPATGTISHLVWPDGARIDSGITAGSTISPWYDPMIAKLTVHGPDRATALRNLADALGNTRIAGTVTNLGFLGRLARQPRFVAGDVETGLIADHLDALAAPASADAPRLALAALVAAGLGDRATGGVTLWTPLTQDVTLQNGDAVVVVRLTSMSGGWQAQIGETTCHLVLRGDQWFCDGKRLPASRRVGDQIVAFGPDPLTLTHPDPCARQADFTGGDTVLAPMPGLVQQVAVGVGDTVTRDQRLVVLEAMKMEHVLRAPRDGIINAVSVIQGAQVSAGDLLIGLEPAS